MPSPETPLDLAAIEKAAKEATPGPWEADSFGLYVFGPSEKGGTFPVADTDEEKPGSVVRIRGWGYFTGHGHGALKLSQEEAAKRQKANADFIALANPATILALCERIRELEAGLLPFADVDGEGDEDFPDSTSVVVQFGRTTYFPLRLGDFRKARALITETDNG